MSGTPKTFAGRPASTVFKDGTVTGISSGVGSHGKLTHAVELENIEVARMLTYAGSILLRHGVQTVGYDLRSKGFHVIRSRLLKGTHESVGTRCRGASSALFRVVTTLTWLRSTSRVLIMSQRVSVSLLKIFTLTSDNNLLLAAPNKQFF